MKEIALMVWFIIILIDVIWQLSEIEVAKKSPVYWRNTLLRCVVAGVFNMIFYLCDGPWLQIGMMQICVYSLAFSIPLNIARRKPRPLLYMGTGSLPERLFKGRNLAYFCVKTWFFIVGLLILYYHEIAESGMDTPAPWQY